MNGEHGKISHRTTQELSVGWQAQAASAIAATGEQIATIGFETSNWLEAQVPGTVLGTLVANEIYQDPYFGINNQNIPDLSDANADYTYWYRVTFEAPTTAPNGRVWLDLRGINYTATLYLNGAKLPIGYTTAPTDTTTGEPLATNAVQGMFLRQRIDITDQLVAGENVLAALLEPPHPPGVPGGNGGKSGNSNISHSVTMRYSVGWDWVQSVPDRCTGLWDRVEVVGTGPVRSSAPQIITKILDATGALSADATVAVSVDLHNPGPVTTATVSYTIVETGQLLQEDVELPVASSGSSAVTFTVTNPRLWWPRRLGAQDMYTLAISVSVGGVGSDNQRVRFGIREIRPEFIDLPGFPFASARRFTVNGQVMFVRGGNWIGTDAMLRADHLSAERYDAELRLLADAGLDLLRVWGGGIAERPEFYEAADALGLLVMQDFWISGESNFGYPAGYEELFLASAADTIRMLRNHPSLLFWSAGNEASPPSAILTGLQEMITGTTAPAPADLGSRSLDPTRILVDKSTSIAYNDGNPYDDGPYGIVPVAAFFQAKSPMMNNPFNPELGSVGTPVVDALIDMMSAADASDFPTEGASGDNSYNETWVQHNYIPLFNRDLKPPNLMTPWGYPADTADFCFLAQILQFEQYRALFEGFTAAMWDRFTGVLLWKVQNPWPGLRGSLHDWRLGQNGCHYGIRSALQALTVQYDPVNMAFSAVNTTGAPVETLSIQATVLRLDGHVLASMTALVGALASPAISTATHLNLPTDLPDVYLIKLVLTDGREVLADKRYWASPTNDFSSLRALAVAPVSASVVTADSEKEQQFTVELENTGTVCAMWLRLTLRRAAPSSTVDTRVLPTFDDDNYVILLPGERRTLSLRCRAGVGAGVWLDGWNRAAMRVGP